MSPRLFFFSSAGSMLVACFCVAPARHYASSAYDLWLSGANVSLVQTAARANHLWGGAILVFAVLAGVLLLVGFRLRHSRARLRDPG